MRIFSILSSIVVLVSLLTPGAEAAQKNRDKEPKNREKGGPSIEIVITSQERTVLKDWFRDSRNSLPPGLAKRDRLTPGHEKQLRRKGTLPPGLAKRYHPLPVTLNDRMRRLPVGIIRVVLGRHVLLLEEESGLIHDIVRDVLP